MKISIVTPNFNYLRFLRRAVESVCSQFDPAESVQIEHIIVDAVSTDGTVAWLQETFPHGRIEDPPSYVPCSKPYSLVWVSEPDHGQTDAINKGFRMASGDILCWLNSDETYRAGALAKVANHFAQHSETDVLYGEAVFVDERTGAQKIRYDHPFNKKILLYYGCHIMSVATFMRRRLIHGQGCFLDPSYKVAMDYDLYTRACFEFGAKFCFIPEQLGLFVRHDENVSSVFKEKRREECLGILSRYSSVMKRIPERRRLQAMDRYCRLFRLIRGAKIICRKLLG